MNLDLGPFTVETITVEGKEIRIVTGIIHKEMVGCSRLTFKGDYEVSISSEVNNNSELKDFVLNHEIGHIVLGHVDKSMRGNFFIACFYRTWLMQTIHEIQADKYAIKQGAQRKVITSLLDRINNTILTSEVFSPYLKLLVRTQLNIRKLALA